MRSGDAHRCLQSRAACLLATALGRFPSRGTLKHAAHNPNPAPHRAAAPLSREWLMRDERSSELASLCARAALCPAAFHSPRGSARSVASHRDRSASRRRDERQTPGARSSPSRVQRAFTKTPQGRRYDNGMQLRHGMPVRADWQRRYFPHGVVHYPYYFPTYTSATSLSRRSASTSALCALRLRAHCYTDRRRRSLSTFPYSSAIPVKGMPRSVTKRTIWIWMRSGTENPASPMPWTSFAKPFVAVRDALVALTVPQDPHCDL